MSVTPATPTSGVNTAVAQGGTSVLAANPVATSGFIYNPPDLVGQNVTTPEPLYVDVVGTCPNLVSGGTVVRIEPGQTFYLITGQTTPTYVNAATGGHKFTVVVW